MQHDIRWRQRFENFRKAYAQLDGALKITQPNIVERAGIIQMFEFTFELAWKTLKDYLYEQGMNEITGSRDTIRKAFSLDLISGGSDWMKMLESRNLTTHIYDEDIATDILADIINRYNPLFLELQKTLNKLQDD